MRTGWDTADARYEKGTMEYSEPEGAAAAEQDEPWK